MACYSDYPISFLSIALSIANIALLTIGCSSGSPEAHLAKPSQRIYQTVSAVSPPCTVDCLAGQLPTPRYHIYSEKVVNFDEGSIRYIETGFGESQTLLLMHGATFRAELWKDLRTMHYFSRLGYHVVSADLPRHGKSTSPRISQSNYLKHFVDAAGFDKPIIVGHSYAGAYILPFLTQHQDDIRGTVLIAPTNVKQYVEALKDSPVPSLIMWGANDEMISVHQANLLHNTMKNSLLKIIPGARHECYNNNTTLFHRQIEDFLNWLRTDKASLN